MGIPKRNTIALVATAVVATVAVGMLVTDRGAASTATAQAASPAHEIVSDGDALPGVMDQGLSAESVSDAQEIAGERLRVPPASRLGPVKRVVTFDAQSGKTGIGIEYESSAEFSARPGRPEGSLKSKLGVRFTNYQTGKVTYPMAESELHEVVEVAGRFGLLRAPGSKTHPDGHVLRYAGFHLAVQEEDVVYVIDSRDSGLTKADVLAIGESLFD